MDQKKSVIPGLYRFQWKGVNVVKILRNWKSEKNTVILVENGNQKMWKWISGNVKCTLECDHGRRTMVQT